MLKGSCKIWDHLSRPRDHDVMRWENGKGAATGTFHRDHDSTGLRYKDFTAGDAGIARLKVVDLIASVGFDNRQLEPFQEGIDVVLRVTTDLFPSPFRGELNQDVASGLYGGAAMELGLESFGNLGEEVDLLGKCHSDLREPLTLAVAVGFRSSIGLGMRGVRSRGRVIPECFADPVQDNGATGIHFFQGFPFVRSFLHCS